MNLEIGKIYHRIRKLSREQKKIIYVGLVVFIFLLCAWSFIYRPQGKKFAGIKKELAETENQINEVLSIARGRDLAIAIQELKAGLNKISAKLPQDDDVVIYNLSEIAKKFRIEVKNINPAPKRQLKEEINGYLIEELSISMSMSCEYKVLGEFLSQLRNNFGVLIRIRKLEIRGKGEARPDLEINLELSGFLSKEKI